MTTLNNTTTDVNADLLNIPTPEVLINTIRQCTPQQVGEKINEVLIRELKQRLVNCFNNYYIKDLNIDITNFCVGYTHDLVVHICKTILDKYRSLGYVLDAKLKSFDEGGIRKIVSLDIHSIELPTTKDQKININPPAYDEITNKPTPVKEAYI